MSIYEKNLEAVKKRSEELYEAVLNAETESEGSLYCVEAAKNGMPIFCSKGEGGIIYLNSRYNPQREAERYAAQFKYMRDYAFVCFFGFGNGMAAKELLREKGEHIVFAYYEPSLQLFRLTMEYYDITELLECERVGIYVKDVNDEGFKGMSSAINAQNYRISRYEVLPVYKELFGDEEKEIRALYGFWLDAVYSDIATGKLFAKTIAYNNIYNMRYIFGCSCEDEFAGVFPVDRPAIIVAAGPSLEKNVKELRKAKGILLIIAADTALPYLISQGIQPDLAMVIDATKPPKIFDEDRAKNVPLAIATEANYKIVEKMEGRVIYASSGCAYYNQLFQIGGRKLYHLNTGGSVATSAFTMALSWGYRKIILVGQDLALSPDKVHAGNVGIRDDRLSEYKIEIDGYNGDKVYTLLDFDFYRKWYEQVIEGDEDIEVINATEGGAKIKGAVQMTLREAIEDCDVEPFDFEKAIRDMPPALTEEHKEVVIHMWQDSLKNLDILKQKLYDGIRQTQYGIKIIKSKQYKRSQVARVQKRLNELIEECNSVVEIGFLNEIVAEQESDVLGDIHIGRDDNDEETCRVFEKMMKYMKSLHGAVDEVKELFEKIITDVENVV